MKKSARLFALCTAAVLLTMGSAVVSMAAQTGWAKEGDQWCYLDSGGNKMTDVWKKSGNFWYYLGSDGVMVTDQWVDDTYYTDINGVMVTNQWVYVNEGTDNAPNTDGGWFYLDAGGKVVTDGWKTINGKKYYFDSDGTMLYGWLTDNEDTYYLGDENQGWAQTGWVCLDYDPENPPSDGDVSAVETSGSDTSEEDATGIITTATASNAGYDSGDGSWYYFDSNGVPKYLKANADSMSQAVVRINGQSYFFDQYGRMQYSLIGLEPV